jgi:hypothetical protein
MRYKQEYDSRKGSKGNIPTHIAIAERALGKPLPPNAEVHHVDENKLNNQKNNLVICQDHSYHRLLHVRTRVLKIGGDPNTQKICCECKQLILKNNFNFHKNTYDKLQQVCRNCAIIIRKRYR